MTLTQKKKTKKKTINELKVYPSSLVDRVPLGFGYRSKISKNSLNRMRVDWLFVNGGFYVVVKFCNRNPKKTIQMTHILHQNWWWLFQLFRCNFGQYRKDLDQKWKEIRWYSILSRISSWSAVIERTGYQVIEIQSKSTSNNIAVTDQNSIQHQWKSHKGVLVSIHSFQVKFGSVFVNLISPVLLIVDSSQT